MGWCTEFGCRIKDGCDQAMVAGREACSCSACATACRGLFVGCPEVWAAGPRPAVRSEPKPLSIVPEPAAVRPARVPPRPPTPASTPAPAPTPAPSPATRTPAPAAADKELRSIRQELVDLRDDLGGALNRLGEVRAEVRDLARSTQDTVDGIRKELQSLSELVAAQQAALARMSETSSIAAGARASYEQLVEKRRSSVGNGPSPALRPLARIPMSLHNGRHPGTGAAGDEIPGGGDQAR